MKPEKTLARATVCFLVRNKQVLLARKRENISLSERKIGEGKITGYGGGIEPGETPLQCAIRETFVESDGVVVAPGQTGMRAVVDFHNTKADGETFVCRVFMFVAREWQGVPKDTSEMHGAMWYEFNSLPFEDMMPADPEWLPVMLSGKMIYAVAHYGPRQETLLGPVEIIEVNDLAPYL